MLLLRANNLFFYFKNIFTSLLDILLVHDYKGKRFMLCSYINSSIYIHVCKDDIYVTTLYYLSFIYLDFGVQNN